VSGRSLLKAVTNNASEFEPLKGRWPEMAKIISLGVHMIQLGVKGDANRIKTMVGGFNHWLGDDGLNPDRFAVSENDPERWRERAGIEGWLEGERKFELFAANFGIGFPNYGAMLEAASNDSTLAELQRGGFPHFQPFFSVEKVEWLYIKYGISWLEATDENSLWRYDDGGLCAPYLRCDPHCRYLNAYHVGNDRLAPDWFSFVRELSPSA